MSRNHITMVLAMLGCLAGNSQAAAVDGWSDISGNVLHWTATSALEFPVQTEVGSTHLAYKDPSVVQAKGAWHVLASHVRYIGGKSHYSLVYLGFPTWEAASTARVVPLLTDEELTCAPHVFRYGPHGKWYVFYVWHDRVTKYRGPAYSTFDDIDRPETITKPRPCFNSIPQTLPKKGAWLDFSIIADDRQVYLFFTDDAGHFLRSATQREAFPTSWGDPETVLTAPTSEIFEGSCTYQVQGTGSYLTIIEAIGPQGRFYNAFEAPRLDGAWKPLSRTADHPFAGSANVTFPADQSPWTKHVSHGELLRAGEDEFMMLDPSHLRFLIQGWDGVTRVPGVPLGKFNGYHETPWRLGLLQAK